MEPQPSNSEPVRIMEPVLTPEQIAAHEARMAARQAAAADPLPGPLMEAFSPDPISFHGSELRPMVAYDLTILKKLNSPLFRHLLEMEKPEEERVKVEFEDDDVWELVFLFTRPVAEANILLRKGRDVFYKSAMEAFGYKAELGSLPIAEIAVTNHFARALATAVGYRPSASPGQDGKVFMMPPACPATGSAGG